MVVIILVRLCEMRLLSDQPLNKKKLILQNFVNYLVFFTIKIDSVTSVSKKVVIKKCSTPDGILEVNKKMKKLH